MQPVLDYSAAHVSTVSFTEIVTVDEAKTRLRIDHSDEDQDIATQILSARIKVEKDTRRSFAAHTYDFSYDRFPECRYIRFAGYTPLQSVTHLKYIDTDGTLQTWGTSNYEVDEARDTVWLAYNIDWPEIRDVQNAVQIRAVFGHATTDDEYKLAKTAVLLLVGHWYMHREPITDKTGSELGLSYTSLIDTIAKRSYP